MATSLSALERLKFSFRVFLFVALSVLSFAQVAVIPAPPVTVPGTASPAPSVDQDQEGFSVAASSRFIVIGRPGREVAHGGTNVEAAGQVIVWELEEGYLKRSSTIDALIPRPGTFFGGAVATSGNWVAVAQGLPRISIAGAVSGTKTNRVQMIEFLENGDWRAGQDLIPSGPDAGMMTGSGGAFADNLAMQGTTLVVSSTLGPIIYDLDDTGIWNRTERIDAPESAGASSAFGARIAMSGEILLIGAPSFPNQAVDGFVPQQGRVYLFRRGVGGHYVLDTDFVAPDGAMGDRFGDAVTVEKQEDAEMVAIGAPNKDVRFSPSNLQPNHGNVYIFRRTLPDGNWFLEKQITNFFNTTASPDLMAGSLVALRGRRLAVCSGPAAKGAQYFYRSDDGTWSSSGTISGPGGYGPALVGFEYGFVVGIPFSGLRNGRWEWRSMDPYLAFINQTAPGPFFGGQPVSNRRGDADPDGDGIKNSDEFFFGSDPLTANTSDAVQPTVDAATKQFKVRWDEAFNTYGLKSKAAWTTNAGTGPWLTNNLQIVTLTNLPGSTNKRYEARLSMTGLTNVFFRLTVE